MRTTVELPDELFRRGRIEQDLDPIRVGFAYGIFDDVQPVLKLETDEK